MKRTTTALSVYALAWAMSSHAHATDRHPQDQSLKDGPQTTYEGPTYNWQGLYGGVFLGGANEIWNIDLSRNANHGATEIGSTGIAYGAWLGYNVMLDRNIVLGIEADIGKATASQSNNIFDNDTSYSSIGTFGSIRGRYGYAIDRFLVYATAGLAFASVTNDLQKGRNAGEEYVYEDKWQTGYAVGGGLEYAISSNVVARAEYIYSNYGTVSLYNRDGNLAEMTNDMHLVRLGVSYKF